MSNRPGFEIDFTEAKSISSLSSQIDFKPMNPVDLDKLWAVTAPRRAGRVSGACAIGTILHHHDIGWSHIPKDRHGRPQNDAFVNEIIRWSKMPASGSETQADSTQQANGPDMAPATVLQALQKAGLIAHWYADNSASDTLQIIRLELLQGRPVMTLLREPGEDLTGPCSWEVIYKLEDNTLYTKQCMPPNTDRAWPYALLTDQWVLEPPRLSRSIVTAARD